MTTAVGTLRPSLIGIWIGLMVHARIGPSERWVWHPFTHGRASILMAMRHKILSLCLITPGYLI